LLLVQYFNTAGHGMAGPQLMGSLISSEGKRRFRVLRADGKEQQEPSMQSRQQRRELRLRDEKPADVFCVDIGELLPIFPRARYEAMELLSRLVNGFVAKSEPAEATPPDTELAEPCWVEQVAPSFVYVCLFAKNESKDRKEMAALLCANRDCPHADARILSGTLFCTLLFVLQCALSNGAQLCYWRWPRSLLCSSSLGHWKAAQEVQPLLVFRLLLRIVPAGRLVGHGSLAPLLVSVAHAHSLSAPVCCCISPGRGTRSAFASPSPRAKASRICCGGRACHTSAPRLSMRPAQCGRSRARRLRRR
jgi:hypothetical protein